MKRLLAQGFEQVRDVLTSLRATRMLKPCERVLLLTVLFPTEMLAQGFEPDCETHCVRLA